MIDGAILENGRPESPPEKWARQEQALKDMLQVETLPRQIINRSEWRRFDERLACGDADLKNEIVTRRLRSAYSAAQRYSQRFGERDITLEDFFQYACEGVQHAVNIYQPGSEKSLRDMINFNIYASLQKNALTRGLVTIEAEAAQGQANMKKAKQQLEKQLGGAAVSRQQLAEATGQDLATIEVFERFERQQQIDDFKRNDEVVDDDFPPDEQAETSIKAQNLYGCLRSLPARQQLFLRLKFGIAGLAPRTDQAISQLLEVSVTDVAKTIRLSKKNLISMEETWKLR